MVYLFGLNAIIITIIFNTYKPMKLFVYNHCPYCVKSRLVADLSSLDYELVFLANDDEKSHIDRIGSKQVPFLEKADGTFLKESINVCEYIAKLKNFDIAESQINDEIKNILAELPDDYRRIIYPRMPHHPANECDFPTQSAKDYFINKKSKYIGDMDALLKNPPYDSIVAINKALAEIDNHIKQPFINGDQFSWDDINIFPTFFILTVAKGMIEFPENVAKYMQSIESKTNIELY
ncbi:MAG: glutaredoxin 2 [Francisella sp.]|jgi:glutaredoxin 2